MQEDEMCRRKQEMRRAVRETLRGLEPERREQRDRQILDGAAGLPELRQARTVMAYSPLPDEVQLLPLLADLIARGTKIGLPRVLRESGRLAVHAVRCLDADCTPGAMGILEPGSGLPVLAPEAVDVVLVPGRVFTAAGDRLGRGGGYYDRFLRSCPWARRVALCYEEQVVPELPMTEQDERVDVLVTPERVIRTGARRENEKGG